MNTLSVDAFAARFNGRPAADEAQRKCRIDSTGITGNAAVATIVLEYPAITFYRLHVSVEDRWRMEDRQQALSRRA